MVPFVMMVLNLSMIGVALPSIRSSFGAEADLVSWTITAYTLPYVILMSLYGRLGDGIGKRRLFIVGVAVFLLGTIINLASSSLSWLMVGRAIQGIGAAGIPPLAIAMISELFPGDRRGAALGKWNSVGPIASIVGGLLAGPIIDTLGWHAIFAPVSLVGLAALVAVYVLVPRMRVEGRHRSVRSFDWKGALLLGAGITALLCYASSKPITGVAPLQDWRLLAITVPLFVMFVLWESRQASPFVSLSIFSHGSFTQASLCVAVRMFTMSGVTFLIPLYLADVQGLGAMGIGLAAMTHAAGLFPTMRLGGKLADRWGSRWPVVFGMATQTIAMVYFALLGSEASLGAVFAGLVAHGLAAGLSLPAFHRAAMGGVPPRQMGMAAGAYSMIRFFGSLLGAALGGVVLQRGLDQGLLAVEAYRVGFGFVAMVAPLGVVAGLTLRE